MKAKHEITSTKHLNDYGIACINGFKGTIYEYLQQQYKGYCEICKRCDIVPKSYDEWRVNQES